MSPAWRDTLRAFEIAVDATLKSTRRRAKYATHKSAGGGHGARGMRKRLDAIIVGAGHNGLVAACYLARAGLKVLVLERNAYIGGAAVSRRCTGFHLLELLLRVQPAAAGDHAHAGAAEARPAGHPYEGGCTMMQGGGHLALYDNHDALRREIARHSKRDAEAYDRYSRDVMRQCKFIKPLLMREPPDPTSFKPRDIMELLYLGKRFPRPGRGAHVRHAALLDHERADFLDEYFESEIVKAHFAGSSIIGTALGPRSPGTAYVLLHHYMGDIDDTVGAWGFARGGMGAISKALGASFEASGGTIRSAAPVARSWCATAAPRRGARDGEEIHAPLVISNMDVRAPS
jgi:phytoene dehydrogenase-like protein